MSFTKDQLDAIAGVVCTLHGNGYGLSIEDCFEALRMAARELECQFTEEIGEWEKSVGYDRFGGSILSEEEHAAALAETAIERSEREAAFEWYRRS